MPLQTTSGPPDLLAALFPPGNVSAILSVYRGELFRLLGAPAAFPFPCAAPLAWISEPSETDLANIAQHAPRAYGRLVYTDGFLFLAPAEQDAPRKDVRGGYPIPCGRGFPLAYFPESEKAPRDLAALPPPPSLSFRTFQTAALSLHWAASWYTGLTWETVRSVRYPSRILSAP